MLERYELIDQDVHPTLSELAGIGHCSDTIRSNTDGPDRARYGLPSGDLARSRDRGLLFCIAGGFSLAQAHGSQIAIDRIQEAYYHERTTDRCRALRRAFEAANHAVFESSNGVLFNDLSVSVACVVLDSGTLTVAHAGDCRVYVVRSQYLQQLTRDHVTFVESISDEEHDADQLKAPPLRLLQHSVGSMPIIEIDCNSFDLQLDSRVLMCTQGLTNALNDDELRATALSGAPDAAARGLVALAKERGTCEDLTAVVIEPSLLSHAIIPAQSRAEAAKTFSLVATCIAILLLLAVALAQKDFGKFRGLANAEAPSVTVTPPAATAPSATPVAAVALATATPQPTATPSASLPPTASATPTLSSTPTQEPTETPSETPSPEPTLTPSPRPTNTAAAPLTPRTTPAPSLQLRYAAVRLREPQNDQTVSGATATFEFEQQTLLSGDSYVVYFRRAGDTTWSGTCRGARDGPCVLQRESILGTGIYEWMVAITDASGVAVSSPSEIRRIRWSDAPEPPESSPRCIPQPTNRC